MCKKRMSLMRQEIMLCVQANNVPNSGEIFLKLVFLSELALVKVCQQLHIRPPEKHDIAITQPK